MRSAREPDYQSLAELRYQIRRFLHFSERAARDAGLEPSQHQLLLALKGLPANVRPTVGALAERLHIRPHSAVELVNRLHHRGFVRRRRGNGGGDRRQVLLSLTAQGEKVLRALTFYHHEELLHAGPALIEALQAVLKEQRSRTKRMRRGTANVLAG